MSKRSRLGMKAVCFMLAVRGSFEVMTFTEPTKAVRRT